MIIEPQPVAAPPRHFKAIIIGGIALAILFPFIIELGLLPFHLDYGVRLLCSRFIFWAEVLGLMLYAVKVERQPFFTWKERDFDIMFFAGSVVLLYILMWVAGFIAAIPHLLGVRDNDELVKKVAKLLQGHYGILVFTALTAGVTEELIFRGYILTRLSLLFKNKYVPVIISSVLFAAVHFPYKSLREYIFVFLFGTICAVYYQRYRDMKVIITVHFLVDLVAMTVAQHYVK